MPLFTINKIECSAVAFEERQNQQRFTAACIFIMVVIVYCFFCFFQKPMLDMTTPLIGIATLLIGYYYGSSKSSQDANKTITRQIDTAANVAAIASTSPATRDAIIKTQAEVPLVSPIPLDFLEWYKAKGGTVELLVKGTPEYETQWQDFLKTKDAAK